MLDKPVPDNQPTRRAVNTAEFCADKLGAF
jgi:hypothetical protein